MKGEEMTTEIVKVQPETDESVIALHEQALKLQQYAQALVIASDDNIKGATNDLSLISGLKKAIEEKRKDYISPINEHLKAINDAFKAFIEPLTYADKITRQKILDYRAEQERIRLEQERINEMRKEAAEAEMELNGELSESVNLIETQPEQPKHYRAEAGTSGTVNLWKFEVVDFALLPDRFKMENATLIGKVVRAGEREIPGVRIWSEESLRVTTK